MTKNKKSTKKTIKSVIKPKVYGYNEKTGEQHCLKCGVSMGKSEHRQLCGKFVCDGYESD